MTISFSDCTVGQQWKTRLNIAIGNYMIDGKNVYVTTDSTMIVNITEKDKNSFFSGDFSVYEPIFSNLRTLL